MRQIVLLVYSVSLGVESTWANLPSQYTELNDYVVKAPNQGDTNTCLYQAATGAMEILISRRMNIRNPQPMGETDLSERYLISEDASARSRSWFEDAFLKFDTGEAFLQKVLPFHSFTKLGDINNAVWNTPRGFDTASRIRIPKPETVFLFSVGTKYSRNVLSESHVTRIKEALVKYRSPIMVIGNDEEYWHAVLITGYDDSIEGDCYELETGSCRPQGAFYVRDSFGTRLEERSYDWFVRRNNSAAVMGLRDEITPIQSGGR